MMVLHAAGIDQGGFGAAEGPSQQLSVLREAAGCDVMVLQDAGIDQGGWSVAEGPSQQLAVLLRKVGHDGSTGRRYRPRWIRSSGWSKPSADSTARSRF